MCKDHYQQTATSICPPPLSSPLVSGYVFYKRPIVKKTFLRCFSCSMQYRGWQGQHRREFWGQSSVDRSHSAPMLHPRYAVFLVVQPRPGVPALRAVSPLASFFFVELSPLGIFIEEGGRVFQQGAAPLIPLLIP